MANDISGNPFALDTPNFGNIFAPDTKIYIKTIRWTSPTAVAGHRVILTDQRDRVIWESVANGANYAEVDHLDPREFFMGLKIPNLDSGRVLLYIL